MGTRVSRLLWVAAALFFLSGFAAVLYQVIWQRILGIFSGVHISSITIIVTAFMAGLGFGSLVGGKVADRLDTRKAILAFAVCELLIGAFALVSPLLFYDVAYHRLGFLVRYPLVLPFVHFLLLVFPTFFMGASLPFLARGLVEQTGAAARTIGLLYGLNTIGAGVGALVSVWFLVGEIGFVGAIRVGAVLNGAAAVGAFAMARASAAPAREAEDVERPFRAVPPEPPAGRDRSWLRWAWLYGLSGFIALSFEILWFRYLDVAIKSSPYTFGHVLGIFLVLLGLGSVVGTALVERSARPERIFLLGQWGIATSAALGMLLLSRIPSDSAVLAPYLLHWFLPGSPEIAAVRDAMRGAADPESTAALGTFYRIYLGLPFWLLTVPVFLMGLTYAYVQKTVQTSLGDVGWRTGVVQTANIVGSMLGSLVTGALLLSALGTPRSFQVIALVGILVFGTLAARRLQGRGRRGFQAAIVAAVLLVLGLPTPREFWARFHGMTESGTIVAEDASGVAALQVGIPNLDYVPMRVNGKMHSRVPFGDEHTLLGVLPALVHPRLETATIIGLGSGNTAWAAGCREYTRRIDVYEIVAPEVDVLEELQRHERAHECVRQVLEDARIQIRFTDGRLALRTTEEQYDLVEADGLDPSMSFSGNLYSREFFELCRSRLAPGGILCSYVPTERTLWTVVEVFPYVLDFHAKPDFASFVIASNEPIPFDVEALRARFYEPWTQQYFARAGLLEYTRGLFEQFLSQMEVREISGAARDQFPRGEANTDLFPRDEFDKSYRGDYQ